MSACTAVPCGRRVCDGSDTPFADGLGRDSNPYRPLQRGRRAVGRGQADAGGGTTGKRAGSRDGDEENDGERQKDRLQVDMLAGSTFVSVMEAFAGDEGSPMAVEDLAAGHSARREDLAMLSSKGQFVVKLPRDRVLS